MTLHRAPGIFDTFLFADYSGASDAASQRKAISLFRLDRDWRAPRKMAGPFTRSSLRETIVRELSLATRENRRVLFGIDHQWSWPTDLRVAAGVDRLEWRRFLATLVKGTRALPPLSAPSLYAAAFNRAVTTPVFYSRVKGLARSYGIPSQSAWSGEATRLTERAMKGAKPSNRLGGTGAVGGQTLTGFLELHQLFRELKRLGLPVIAWPFDAVADDGRFHVGCEIYPGFCKRELGRDFKTKAAWTEHDRDAAAVCAWARGADLAPRFDLRAALPAVRRKAQREGWILGAALPV